MKTNISQFGLAIAEINFKLRLSIVKSMTITQKDWYDKEQNNAVSAGELIQSQANYFSS